jgi:hypothetical protein
MTEVWSNWPEPTVEADPLSLVPFLTARTAERDEARAQRDSARSWCVALEQRLAMVEEIVKEADFGRHVWPEAGCLACYLKQELRRELVAE